jgi:hypothetical protein
MDSTTAFLEDLARHLDIWLAQGALAMTDPSAEIKWTDKPEAFRAIAPHLSTPECRAAVHTALLELLTGLSHSFLVTLDGGTALAQQTSLSLTDSAGQELESGLHERFYDLLFATGRFT